MVGAAVSAPITAAALTATAVGLTAYDAYTGASGALSNLGPNASTGEKAKAATIGGGEGILRGIFGGIDFEKNNFYSTCLFSFVGVQIESDFRSLAIYADT